MGAEGTVPVRNPPLRRGRGHRVSGPRPLYWLGGVAALVVGLPLALILGAWLQPETEVWRHLAETVLDDLIVNTLVLVAGVGVGVVVLGVGLAWLTAVCEFPGRRFFDWALMLPLAVPTYVLAFVALGLLDFDGPVQAWLRRLVGSDAPQLFEIRTPAGVIGVMVLVLYPYVYLLARSAFITQGAGSLEAARLLGLGPWGTFFRVALPMARPAIVAGTSLALMEALADFGAVAVFNYDTFTTAIYKAWFGLFNLHAASQLASLLLVFVAAVLALERWTRGRARYAEAGRSRRLHRHRLSGAHRWLAASAAALVFLAAFGAPLVQLLVWAWAAWAEGMDARYPALVGHTLALGAMAALCTAAVALGLAYLQRGAGFWGRVLVRVATLGYALPGSVLAVGVMLAFTRLDAWVEPLWRWAAVDPAPLLAGSLGALVVAYLIRFMAVAHGALDSGLARIRPNLAEAARSLGARRLEVLRRVHLPLLQPALFSALLLVLVEVMKEMPATLLLRPFGWDTLAVRIYELTSEGEWQRAALPSVTLVLVGLIPVVLLVRRSAARERAP